MPPVYKLDSFKKKVNQFFSIQNNQHGFYVNAQEKISFVLTKIWERMPIVNNEFRIHLLGDGCNVSRTRIKIVKFCFKVINEMNDSVTGIYHLGNFF